MPSSVSHPRGRARSFSWRVALVLATVLALLCFLFIRVRLHLHTSAKLADVRSAGLPASGADLNQWLPSVAPDKNGALVITQAFALFRSVPEINLASSTLDNFIATSIWPPELRTSIRDLLETNTPALNKLDVGLEFNRFRYPVDYTPGPTTLLPHLSRVMKAESLMSLRTALAAEESQDNQSDPWAPLLFQQERSPCEPTWHKTASLFPGDKRCFRSAPYPNS